MMDIVLDRICKSYGPKPVLHDFSCIIAKGTRCAVMAPSGTGKTTLLRLILGLETPDSGKISGVPTRKSAQFQEDRLCPNLSVRTNIRMAVPNANREEMENVLCSLGLTDCMTSPASTLSGGMARRAALARALLHSGDLLVLDEPFSGLDERNRLLAAETILNHLHGRTLLLVTHRPEDLTLLDIENCICL